MSLAQVLREATRFPPRDDAFGFLSDCPDFEGMDDIIQLIGRKPPKDQNE